MIFGAVSSSSIPINAFAADMPGDSMDEGGSGGEGDDNQGGNSGGEDNDIPDSKEAPATAGALTAGGDSDDDDNNDNDSGGNRENDNDNNDDNEPTSEDAPATTGALTADKPECPAGQEYYLFSTSCKPVGGSDSTGGASSATNSCPPVTPTSYNDPQEMQWSLLHLVADEDVPAGTESNQDTEGFGTFGKQSTGASRSDPCPSEGDEQVSETRERLAGGGTMTTSTKQDGTKEVTILNLNGVLNPEGKLVPDAVEQVTKYNAQNKPTRTDSYDRSQNVISTTNYDPKGNPTLTTNYDAKGEVTGTATYDYDSKNRQAGISHFDPQKNLIDKTTNTYYANGLPKASLTVDGNNTPTSKTIYAGGSTPQSIITYVNGKPSSVTRYDDNGQETETTLFGPDGKPISPGAATPEK
jgi:hypothetical protein